MRIYFTDQEHRAFERMMQETPGFDHYDSGEKDAPPECRDCHSYRPDRQDRYCEYPECPFEPGRSTARESPGADI